MLPLRQEMRAADTPSPELAPLQRVMLRNSLSNPSAGHHVEQVEIHFTPGEWRARVAAAWEETVAKTEALKIAFLINVGESGGIELISPPAIVVQWGNLPEPWDSWLAEDRQRALLRPHQVPWRAIYWPQDGRFLWTVHHALLGGRSITAVLRAFITRLAGGEAEELALSKWHPPSAEVIARARKMFQEDFPVSAPVFSQSDNSSGDLAVRHLGEAFREKLEQTSADLEVTAATVLIWAWGQALAESSGVESVVVEQVRSGAPQPSTAGFVMHLLPVLIFRAVEGDRIIRHVQEFRARLLALRVIEGVSQEDFLPGVFPDVNQSGSSVIMVERGTLQYLLDGGKMVESIQLHESKGESLMATAHILPDLRLEVEGPGRHDLLDAWIRVLQGLILPQRTLTPRL